MRNVINCLAIESNSGFRECDAELSAFVQRRYLHDHLNNINCSRKSCTLEFIIFQQRLLYFSKIYDHIQFTLTMHILVKDGHLKFRVIYILVYLTWWIKTLNGLKYVTGGMTSQFATLHHPVAVCYKIFANNLLILRKSLT